MTDEERPAVCEGMSDEECADMILGDAGGSLSAILDDGPAAALAAAVGVSTAVVIDTFHFMEDFIDDPIGVISGPITDFLVDRAFGMYDAIFGFMLSIADLIVDIARQSVFDPISAIYVIITWPLVTFIDGYYALALSSAEAAGPFAPVVVIAFFLALMVIVYAIGVTISTALSVFIGVRLDQLALSLWHRLNRVTGRVMPLPDRLSGGDDE